MMIIKESKWQDVKPFWKDNDSFQGAAPPTSIEIVPVLDIKAMAYNRDKVLIAELNEETVGCVRIETKHYNHVRIAALGKMSVKQEYRKNGIADALMTSALLYMQQGFFEVSVLWASVLRLYEKYGYVAVRENMMIRYFSNTSLSYKEIIDIPKNIGCW